MKYLYIICMLMGVLWGTGAQAQMLDTKLVNAARFGDAKYVKQLLKDGAKITARDVNGKSALQLAIENGHDDVVAVLVENDADVTLIDPADGNTVLHKAVEKNEPAMLQALLAKKVRTNVRNKDGETPLTLAVKKNYVECVRVFADKGELINLKDVDGNVPLHFAAKEGFSEIAEILLSAEAEVDNKNYKGETPLHFAVMNGHAEVTKILLKHGADANMKTGDGISPLKLAKAADEKGIGDGYEPVKLLLKNGAEPEQETAEAEE